MVPELLHSQIDHPFERQLIEQFHDISFDTRTFRFETRGKIIDDVSYGAIAVAALQDLDGGRIGANDTLGAKQDPGIAQFIMFKAHTPRQFGASEIGRNASQCHRSTSGCQAPGESGLRHRRTRVHRVAPKGRRT